MSKAKELSIAAAQMANDTTAFVVIKINKAGNAILHSEGNVFELCYMKESLAMFIQKVMAGEIKQDVRT